MKLSDPWLRDIWRGKHLLFLCPGQYYWRDMFPGCPSISPSVRHTLQVPLCVQHSAKAMNFHLIIMHVWQWPHYVDVHLVFCFDRDLHLTCSQGHVLHGIFFTESTTWSAAPSKSYSFSTNYHACIWQYTHDVGVHLLFCLTSI